MSEHIHKNDNKSLLLNHFVCPIKYRRNIVSDSVSEIFKRICLQIEERLEIYFLDIELDKDHVHFLIQSVPVNAPEKIIGAVKTITAKAIFRLYLEVKHMLWGGKFWTSGYYVNTLGQYTNEEVIKKYLQNQGRTNYKELHRNQLKLFRHPDGSVAR
ncbi:IS200/IS605 family transposase [Maribacter sp. 2-571]|uniref:IS200/IS605 family transposase n=1 Tax=Maribacter sp. 2-571 TaxID=3417569 RepID=UPI003D32F8AD